MTSVRRIRQLVYSTIPLGGIVLILAILVGDLVDIAIGVLTVTLTVAISIYVRQLPAERIGSTKPTSGSTAIRIFTLGCLFVLVAYVISKYGQAELTEFSQRPSALIATGEIALGTFFGITFPYLIDRVARPRVVHTFENVLIVGFFAGLFIAQEGSGLLYGGAFLVARSILMFYHTSINT